MRTPVSAEEKLAVTLRHLATGESLESLVYQFRIHATTIRLLIEPVCRVIYGLAPEFMKGPENKDEWMDIINKTNERWQFPNCYAAVDGKHIGVICPPDSGSDYYNY